MIRERGINFSAGPAALPEEILFQAREDLLNYQGLGVGILELGHRSATFMSLVEETTALFKQALKIPSEFEVLWLGMPARMHFSALPMNFLQAGDKAAYIVSGMWSQMAYAEAKRLNPNAIYCLNSEHANGYISLPKLEHQLEANTKYLYFSPNETVDGLSYYPPKTLNVPWVADMTSCILTESIDFSRYACIFAGAQKNIANAGLSVVIVRQDFLAEELKTALPYTLNYRTHAQYASLYATPPTFNIYLANLMLKWFEKEGGLAHFEQLSQAKAALLYNSIDASNIFHSRLSQEARSPINVCFSSGDEDKDTLFLQYAEAMGLLGLKGHRAVGGLRASLYNAISLADVASLCACLEEFEMV